MRLAQAAACLLLPRGGGARTELAVGGPDAGDSGAGPRDAGAIVSGRCVAERRVTEITGATNRFPTLARGADAILLGYTRQMGTGPELFAVRLRPNGERIGMPQRIVAGGRGGTLAALLDGTTFGWLHLDPVGRVAGVEVRPDLRITGPPEAFPDRTAQEQPALAIGMGALGFGWTAGVPDTSRIFVGDDDSGRDGFVERGIEGRDVHAAPMNTAAGRIRFVTVVRGAAQVRVFAVDGTMIGDIASVAVRDGEVTHAVAVANRLDDGVVVAGPGVLGMRHEGRNRRIEVLGAPEALDAAAENREDGWIVAAASFSGPESPVAAVFASDGT